MGGAAGASLGTVMGGAAGATMGLVVGGAAVTAITTALVEGAAAARRAAEFPTDLKRQNQGDAWQLYGARLESALINAGQSLQPSRCAHTRSLDEDLLGK